MKGISHMKENSERGVGMPSDVKGGVMMPEGKVVKSRNSYGNCGGR